MLGSGADEASEVIKTRGVDNVTVEDLVAEIIPKGRGTQHPIIHSI